MKLDEMDDDQRITMTVRSLKQAILEGARREREACAMVCQRIDDDLMAAWLRSGKLDGYLAARSDGATDCYEAILARGNKNGPEGP